MEDGKRIRELWMGDEARRAGIVYLEEGVRTFELGSGARFTVSGFSLKHCMLRLVGFSSRDLHGEMVLGDGFASWTYPSCNRPGAGELHSADAVG